MKSKSFDSASSSASKVSIGHNHTFDFIRFYKTAEETKASLEKYKTKANEGNELSDDTGPQPSKLEKSASKRKKNKQTAVEMTHICIDGLSLTDSVAAGCSTPVNESSRVTSTLLLRKEKVKSIMKTTNASISDDTVDISRTEPVTSKSKKRNKSVSFMLEDNEELAVKKTKSDTSTTTKPRFKTNNTLKKKFKKEHQAEKENKVSDSNHNVGSEHDKDKRYKDKANNKHSMVVKPVDGGTDTTIPTVDVTAQDKRKKNKPKKARKLEDGAQSTETTQPATNTNKRSKKNKHEQKSMMDEEEEPALKSRKKDIKPEVIAENLENLSIGDNPTTLSNLLDEMTVADKDKRKKLRKKISKSKKVKSKETLETQTPEDIKEKKWKHKRWNKVKKVKETPGGLSAAVIVDNLPISMLFTYKKVLAEHFAKCGLLRNVGVAEVYPSEVSKPVFTTTVYFDTDEAAEKALEEDNSMIEGGVVRVSRPLPATLTTAVLRTYGALTEQAVSSAFATLGRIRSIRLAVKGRKTMSTAFIEFDGPEAVQRAIKAAEDVKIGGKKIHVSKFENRPKKNREEKSAATASDADHSDDGDGHN